MNYFAHAYCFLEDAYFVVGTGVPDWLSVVDRKVRVRAKNAVPYIDDPDDIVAAVARGCVRHLQDDAAFHQTPTFGLVSARLSVIARKALSEDDGLQASFLGHLLTELLLDNHLIQQYPDRLEAYYDALLGVDLLRVEEIVNHMATGHTDKLAILIEKFAEARVLSCYADDIRLFRRVNQVMVRVGFPSLPEAILDHLPPMRSIVDEHADALMAFEA